MVWRNVSYTQEQDFFKENVGHPVCTCRDPIPLILGTRIGSLRHLKKPAQAYKKILQKWCSVTPSGNTVRQHQCGKQARVG